MGEMGDIRTMFAAEVRIIYPQVSLSVGIRRAWEKFDPLCAGACALFAFQLLLMGTTKHFPAGAIIADSRSDADGLMVITSGQVRRVSRLLAARPECKALRLEIAVESGKRDQLIPHSQYDCSLLPTQ
jgi:hypothetical protein